MNGIINVYKEKGFTSHDVVAKLRGICRQKKIGHTGTLDPDAEGVLPVCLGKATKVCDLLTDSQKAYEAILLLGVVTDTQDTSGQILAEKPVHTQEEDVLKTILSFQGEYDQIPPMYSAIKIGGKKLYELAREGKEIERPSRRIHIYEIEILSVELPRVKIRVKCSKGTYIRTLCHDIGEKLGCGGCMEELLRIQAGPFHIDESVKLMKLQEMKDAGTLEESLIPVDKIFSEYPAVIVQQQYNKLLYNGNPIHNSQCKEFSDNLMLTMHNNQCRIYDEEGNFVGIYVYREEKCDWKPLKLFI